MFTFQCQERTGLGGTWVGTESPGGVIPTATLFVVELFVLILLCFLAGELAIRLNAPPLLGELGVGVLLGCTIPESQHWFSSGSQNLEAVGQLGVTLLSGLAGAELRASTLRTRRKPTLLLSLFGFAVPALAGFAIAFLLPVAMVGSEDRRWLLGGLLAVALGVTAIPVTAKMLSDMNLLHTPFGQLVLTSSALQDTVGWVLLSTVVSVAATGSAVSVPVLLMPVLTLVIVLVGRTLFAVAFNYTVDSGRDAAVSAVLCLFIVGSAAAGALVGLELILGSFLAGVVVAGNKRVTVASLVPLRTVTYGIFGPLFFALAGMRVELSPFTQPEVMITLIALLAVAVVSKSAGSYLGARVGGLDHAESRDVSVAMNARGAVEVIVASVGLQAGIFSHGMYAAIIVLAVATSAGAPVALAWSRRANVTSA